MLDTVISELACGEGTMGPPPQKKKKKEAQLHTCTVRGNVRLTWRVRPGLILRGLESGEQQRRSSGLFCSLGVNLWQVLELCVVKILIPVPKGHWSLPLELVGLKFNRDSSLYTLLFLSGQPALKKVLGQNALRRNQHQASISEVQKNFSTSTCKYVSAFSFVRFVSDSITFVYPFFFMWFLSDVT